MNKKSSKIENEKIQRKIQASQFYNADNCRYHQRIRYHLLSESRKSLRQRYIGNVYAARADNSAQPVNIPAYP